MRHGPVSTAEEIVRLELDFTSLELTLDECGKLVGFLRERSRLPGGGSAGAAANRLADLGHEVASMAGERVPEAELDAIADAAWEWVREAGSDAVPGQVLLLLGVLRSRHAHE